MCKYPKRIWKNHILEIESQFLRRAKEPDLFFFLPRMIAWSKWTLFHRLFHVSRNLPRIQWQLVWIMWSVTKLRMPPWQTSPMLMQNPYSGTKKLSWVLPDTEEIAHNMPCALDDDTDAWGTETEREEIRNAKSSVQLPRATGSGTQSPKQGWRSSEGNGCCILGSEQSLSAQYLIP